jgi:hypothetical protein
MNYIKFYNTIQLQTKKLDIQLIKLLLNNNNFIKPEKKEDEKNLVHIYIKLGNYLINNQIIQKNYKFYISLIRNDKIILKKNNSKDILYDYINCYIYLNKFYYKKSY